MSREEQNDHGFHGEEKPSVDIGRSQGRGIGTAYRGLARERSGRNRSGPTGSQSLRMGPATDLASMSSEAAQSRGREVT